MKNLKIEPIYVAICFVLALIVSVLVFSCAKPKIEYLPASGQIIIPSKDLQHVIEGDMTHVPTFEWNKIAEDACQDMGDYNDTQQLLDRCELKLRSCKCE